MKHFITVLVLSSIILMINNAALASESYFDGADRVVEILGALLKIGFAVFIIVFLWKRFKRSQQSKGKK